MKKDFKTKSLGNFWASISDEYETLTTKALDVLVPFTSTELVERAFSSYVFIKNKHRNKLNAGPDLRIYLSTLEPDFKMLSGVRQSQGSRKSD